MILKILKKYYDLLKKDIDEEMNKGVFIDPQKIYTITRELTLKYEKERDSGSDNRLTGQQLEKKVKALGIEDFSSLAYQAGIPHNKANKYYQKMKEDFRFFWIIDSLFTGDGSKLKKLRTLLEEEVS